jgi:hypothetical protein
MAPVEILVKIHIAADLVELVRRYSNRADLRERLAEARSKYRTGQRDRQEHESANAVWGRAPGARRNRLTEGDIERLIAEFLAGTPKRVLSGRYAVSLSTVKNILRKHGVRRVNLR